jgi:hypothetical protein
MNPNPVDDPRSPGMNRHPHCSLSLTRSIAPDHLWHWSVTMPDGHCYAIKGGMSFDVALESLRGEGVQRLHEADAKWRNRCASAAPVDPWGETP